jgi:hypothetical protein
MKGKDSFNLAKNLMVAPVCPSGFDPITNISSLKGEKGEPGSPGAKGEKGEPGSPGGSWNISNCQIKTSRGEAEIRFGTASAVLRCDPGYFLVIHGWSAYFDGSGTFAGTLARAEELQYVNNVPVGIYVMVQQEGLTPSYTDYSLYLNGMCCPAY